VTAAAQARPAGEGMVWASARIAAYAAPEPLSARPVALADALGTTLAAPLRAATPVPAFPSAAMDGYAVGPGGGPWRLVGRVLAGDAEACAVGPGEAAEIGTGAPTPAGTIAVLAYERATRSGDEIAGAAEPGRHVRQVGEDVGLDVDLARAGTVVTPTILGLAAMVGLDDLPVRPRPRVAALLTGTELVHSGQSGGGRVRDGVGPQLPGLVRWLGGELVLVRAVEDTPADLLGAAVAETVAGARPDVLLTVGGAGGGPADRVRGALDRLGARTLVAAVACRPGHPQLLAQLPDGRWVVGLPGNPYAALVAALTLLGPLLAGLAGRRLPTPPSARLLPPAGPGGSAGLEPGTAPRPPAGPGGSAGLEPGTAHRPPAGPEPAAGPASAEIDPGAGSRPPVVSSPPAGSLRSATAAEHLTRIVPVRRVRDNTVEPLGRDRPGNLWGAALADALAVVRPGWQGEPVPLLALPPG